MDLTQIRLNEIEARFISKPLADVERAAGEEMERFKPHVSPGMSVAVAVGSRGISNINKIVQTAVNRLKSFGADPFVVPAMGSHGGATGPGQRQLLEGYGITEDFVGCPIKSSMDTVKIGELGPGAGVYMDKNAYGAQGVFIINRVKAHTDFHGEHESGLVKMLVIGLGKRDQADSVHRYLAFGLKNLIPRAARLVLATGKILGGLAVVEDGYDQVAAIKAALPKEIFELDAGLLKLSKSIMPRLPFDACDVLLTDRMGKNISGTGMDTNVIGRMGIRTEENGSPAINKIAVFDVTEESHGNALGVGLADAIPRRLYDKIDWEATYMNVRTSRFLERAFTPIVCQDDVDTVKTVIKTCGALNVRGLKLAHIADTMRLSRMYVSDALLPCLHDNAVLIEKGLRLAFSAGKLKSVY